MLRLLFMAALALALPLAAACGDDSDDNNNAVRPTPAEVATGTPLTDEQYLAALCTGLANYQEATATSTTVEGIGKAVTDFATSMEKATPPDDLRTFHGEFIAYLHTADKDPTLLLTAPPPKPPDSQRERLASKVKSVSECKYPTFLGENQERPDTTAGKPPRSLRFSPSPASSGEGAGG